MNFAFRWDWKEQPNWIEISNAIAQIISNGYTTINLIEIETGADEYGLLVSTEMLSKEKAFNEWEMLIF